MESEGWPFSTGIFNLGDMQLNQEEKKYMQARNPVYLGFNRKEEKSGSCTRECSYGCLKWIAYCFQNLWIHFVQAVEPWSIPKHAFKFSGSERFGGCCKKRNDFFQMGKGQVGENVSTFS